MKISFEQAKELSIIKWESIINNTLPNFNLCADELNELRQHFSCGFCWRHEFTGIDRKPIEDTCNNCEFGKVAGYCIEDSSLYEEHISEDEDSEKFIDTAKEILEIIKNLKEEC